MLLNGATELVLCQGFPAILKNKLSYGSLTLPHNQIHYFPKLFEKFLNIFFSS